MAEISTFFARCTTRLLAGVAGREPVSTGTGFFYKVPHPTDPGRMAVMVITNKHVVDGCDYFRFTVSSIPEGVDIDRPIPSDQVQQHVVEVDLRSPAFVPHPDGHIDLCAIACSGPFEQVQLAGRHVYAAVVGAEHHLDHEQRSLVRYLERVVMVGYPNGLWDHVNDMPIVRQGSTATHVLHQYQGRPEFVIDMTCLPGSSGSPVFLFEDGLVRSGVGAVSPGSRFALLGVLWGGPQHTLEGQIEIRPVPHSVQPVPLTQAPMNLGYVVSADQLAALAAAVSARLGAA